MSDEPVTADPSRPAVPLAEKDAMSLEQRVADLILRADSMRDSWVDPHGGAAAANALYGAAHDVLCDCEDSTVGHLAEWIAENRPTTARIAGNGAST